MSEAPVESGSTRTAGGMLREARLAQGMHIGALAATIKVTQRKLEALEADRLDELPDATFTRALAQTVCRALKIDPTPVLELLPAPPGHRLEHVSVGLNEPFRDRPGLSEPPDWLSLLASPAAWGLLLILVLTGVVWLMPQHWLPSLQGLGASAPAAGASATTSSVVETPIAAPPVASGAMTTVPAVPPAVQVAPSASAPAAPVAASAVSVAPTSAGALQLRTIGSSWIEVHDAHAQVLLSRVVEPGEALVLDGATPLRLKIGNARATEVVFRGRPLDLAASTRDNVARLELK
ncbi:MAG: helix-turn-helix domain-containing protein [Rhizobacter sp.]